MNVNIKEFEKAAHTVGYNEGYDVGYEAGTEEVIEVLAELAQWREMDRLFVKAVKEIAAERSRQDEKWGTQDHDGGLWLKILMEEVGEVSQAMLHDEFGGHAAGTVDAELVQVAAVVVQWMECRYRDVAKGGG